MATRKGFAFPSITILVVNWGEDSLLKRLRSSSTTSVDNEWFKNGKRFIINLPAQLVKNNKDVKDKFKKGRASPGLPVRRGGVTGVKMWQPWGCSLGLIVSKGIRHKLFLPAFPTFWLILDSLFKRGYWNLGEGTFIWTPLRGSLVISGPSSFRLAPRVNCIEKGPFTNPSKRSTSCCSLSALLVRFKYSIEQDRISMQPILASWSP